MIPPTPTFIPLGGSGLPVIELEPGQWFNMWNFAPNAVQGWNRLGDIGTIIQIAILVMVILLGARTLVAAFRTWQSRTSTSV